jgi:hypothetical protein
LQKAEETPSEKCVPGVFVVRTLFWMACKVITFNAAKNPNKKEAQYFLCWLHVRLESYVTKNWTSLALYYLPLA